MTMTDFHASMINATVMDGVATITINRPDVLNSINPVALHQLHLAFDHASRDTGVQGIVIGGEGKSFAVGADIKFFLRSIEAGDIPRIIKFTQAGHRLMNAIDYCPKPVVARVHGVALGAGAELALACDHVVASPHASFGFPETGLGVYPGWGGTQRTTRAIGVGLAKWLVFSGKTISAVDAWKIGLIDRVVPHEELETACRTCVLGRLAGDKCRTLPQPFTAIGQFFQRSHAEELRNGTAYTGGDPVLIRAMKPVAGKAPNRPAFCGMADRRSAPENRLEKRCRWRSSILAEVFKTQDAYLGLTFGAQLRIGHPEFVGK